LTLPSFCQTSTKTQSSDSVTYRGITKSQLMRDSLVAIPKTIAIWMAQDVERARSYEQEILMMTGVLGTKEDIITKQDTIIQSYKGKVNSYIKLVASCQDLNQQYENDIYKLNKEVTKQTERKKFWMVLAIVLPPLVGTMVHLDWKYGH